MKINISFASRNAPSNLETTLRVLKNLSTGKHEIKYILGLDNDDLSSCVRFQQEYKNDKSVILSIEPRPLTVGMVWNRCIKLFEADAYLPLGDDAMCLTQYWDEYVAELSKKFLIISAFCAYSPHSVVFPILSPKWLKANDWTLFSEHFPYWFNDTWVNEVYEFTTGKLMLVAKDLAFGGNEGKTRGMRDLDFWWGFFNATRKQRIRHGIKLRHKLGLEDPKADDLKEIIDKWEERDSAMREKIPTLSEHYSTDNAVSPRYLLAKKNAEDYLQMHGLKLWECADGKI